MEINRDNYEIYFLDYLDGNLTPLQVADLLLFLEQHPDLKEELDNLEPFCFNPETDVHYPDKHLLKKKNVISVGPVNETNDEEYLIAQLEGDLTPGESRILERFLERNPSLKRQQQLFRLTRLVPDLEIVFPGKHGMKKYPLSIAYRRAIYYGAGLAATLLIGLLVINPFSKNNSWEVSQVTTTQFQNLELNAEPTVDPGLTESITIIPTISIGPTSGPDPDKAGESLSPGTILVTADHELNRMKALHANVTYRIVNSAFAPGDHIIGKEQDRYTPVLPYITESGDYALSAGQNSERQEFGSIGEFTMAKIKGLFSNKEKNGRKLPEINLWTLADIGVYGLSRITDSDLRIDRIKDEKGNTISYALVNEDKEITRIRSKNKESHSRTYE